MWGVDFRNASNCLICATAEFTTQRRDDWRDHYTRYRTGMGPHGTWLDRQDSKGEWERINDRAEPADFEAILPQGDFGKVWTYSDFLLALTFFDEGYKRGYARGEWAAQEQTRQDVDKST